MRSTGFALAAVLALGVVTPATAKKAEPAPAATEAGKVDSKNISKPVRPLLQAAQKAEAAGDTAGAVTQLRAAEAAGGLNSTDQFFIAQMKLGLGGKLKDNALLEEGIKASAASEFLPAAEKPKYIRNLAALALQRNDYAGATTYYEQLTAGGAADSETLTNLALLYEKQKQNPQAIATLHKAIAAGQAAGKPLPENVYLTQLKIAVDNKLAAQVGPASVDLISAYPSPQNWRTVLYIFRDSAKLDDQGNLDVFRLMAAAGALNGERDYAEYVETSIQKGLLGEAKTALAEGTAKGMIAPGKPYVAEFNKSITTRIGADRAGLAAIDKEARAASTGKLALGEGDAYYGYGDYAKAAEMDRLALSKGGVDANTANLRLGAALARAGDKAGATAALQAVKGGMRETLAGYWLIWLGQKA